MSTRLRLYVFTLERQHAPRNEYAPWAVVVIEADLPAVTIKARFSHGDSPGVVEHALEAGEHQCLVAADLLEVERLPTGTPVPNHLDALTSLLEEIEVHYHVRGRAVFQTKQLMTATGDTPPFGVVQSITEAAFSEQQARIRPADGP